MKNIDQLMTVSLEELEIKVVEEMTRGETPDLTVSAWTRDRIKAKLQVIEQKIAETFEKSRGVIFQEVCVKLDYCVRVKDERNTMIALIADSTIIVLFGLPIAPIVLIAYILRLGYFDQFCECAH